MFHGEIKIKTSKHLYLKFVIVYIGIFCCSLLSATQVQLLDSWWQQGPSLNENYHLKSSQLTQWLRLFECVPSTVSPVFAYFQNNSETVSPFGKTIDKVNPPKNTRGSLLQATTVTCLNGSVSEFLLPVRSLQIAITTAESTAETVTGTHVNTGNTGLTFDSVGVWHTRLTEYLLGILAPRWTGAFGWAWQLGQWPPAANQSPKWKVKDPSSARCLKQQEAAFNDNETSSKVC